MEAIQRLSDFLIFPYIIVKLPFFLYTVNHQTKAKKSFHYVVTDSPHASLISQEVFL